MKHMGMELDEYVRKVSDDAEAARKKVEGERHRAESRMSLRLAGLTSETRFSDEDKWSMKWALKELDRLRQFEERYNKIREIVEVE